MQQKDAEAAHVLVVDDEALQRESLRATLEDAGYVVSVAACGEEAIGILESERVEVLCTDFQMPGMNGLELVNQANAASPGTVSVLVTGYPEFVAGGDREPGKRHMLLVKPYRPEDLLRILAQAARLSRIRGVIDRLPGEGRSSGAAGHRS